MTHLVYNRHIPIASLFNVDKRLAYSKVYTVQLWDLYINTNSTRTRRPEYKGQMQRVCKKHTVSGTFYANIKIEKG